MHLKGGLSFCALVVLVACGANSETRSIPEECPQGEFLATFQEYVPNSTFIETDWEPVPSTDLEAVLNANGLACSYGPQEAEVGATVLWANGADLFDARSEQWAADGHQQVEIVGTDEAWALIEETEVERHLWSVNMLVDGVWIGINATFLSDLVEARALIDAAIREA
jgi:hypothetical protein